ncbi:deoxyribose-phosphate aldolase [Pseudobacillus badius]|uniref:deoxyribose-phosphate aldolase n=1 Tax=Bacillus badius TaxID=1455 RepID=UPI0009EF1D0D|nr:deoxyribose-phosphate aldolase [Bacillus badius]MED0664698.1 deoxyribose-phosphate aldolase [Bacillus badius]TDW05030.1 deoxyribose-phosphate aldolase [Bacillus badius]UAT29605.1 deoxyribose-phosphate aldolase [Bacillus badius]GLY10009.1 deoxyribose-phosphate aldolase [Bacillus badius]
MITDQFGDVAKIIDHTLLKPETTKDQVKKLCEEARAYEFASVCINPVWVAYASEQLQGTKVKVCTVIGFPLGATTSTVKAFETKEAIENGATEVDMVINIGALKAGDDETVLKDIQAVTASARGKALTKVIIETSLLTDEEKERACRLAVEAGADYVKTSTGFSTGGATEEDIRFMRKTVGPDIGVKASGGVRSQEDALNMIKAGATRIGASSGVQIVQGLKGTSDY